MDFNTAFQKLLDREGRTLSTDPYDPGNWTGGVCHVGTLKGSKYGISAGAHPDLDIPNLTEDQAAALYQQEYWTPIQGDKLPDPVAYQAFDEAVQAGPKAAVKMLQMAVGVPADGLLGPTTLAALQGMKPIMLTVRLQASMLNFYTSLSDWPTQGKGWARRVAKNLTDLDPYLV